MLFSRIDRAYRRWRRTGDGRQLARVFDATANDLFRLGYHLLGDRHAAEDLVQQTFVVAIEQAVALADGRAVFPWLCGILTNRALHQRRQLRQRAGKGGSVDAAVDPVAEAHTRELQATIAVKVRALPEPYRQVLLLHLVHELAPQDIAEALARSPATVRTQLARGLDLLRKALPASLGIGAMAAVPLPIGLPAVRTAVLQHAQAVVGQGAFMVGGGVALLGGMAMKKALVALLVAVFVVATWSFWDGEQAALPPVATTSSQQGQPTRQGMPGSVAETASAASQRTSAPIPADAPASLAVEVAWHDGTPAADIAVRVTPDRQVGALWLDVERTDCGGIARFAAQTPGVVHVRCDRGTAAKVEVIAGKAASVQLTIARGIDVRGRVVDTEEKPVVGASVWLSVVPNSDETELAATSGSDGTFTLRSVGLNHVLSATTPGRGCAKCAFVRESSATEELVVAVRSVPGMLVGSVVDDRGKPVAGARVLVGVQRTESSEPEHKR